MSTEWFVKVPAEDKEILRDFVNESLQMLEAIYPLITDLARVPGTESRPGVVLSRCFRTFHSMKGSAGFLQLDYFAEVIGAAEHLLVALQENRMPFRKDHADLLLATCDFAGFGLARIKAEKSDDLLAGLAGDLSERLLLAGGEGDTATEANPGADVTSERLEVFSLEADVLLLEAEQEFTLWDYIAVDQPRVTELFRTLHRL
ncbi:MAG: hypothetical protein GQ559_04500, partial [Desulfobulbaceae bacterium]|nr:hypothetical protein [Desulfobulbaceae bacterium]